MPLSPLPAKALDFMDWSWEQIEPHYALIADRAIDAQTVSSWLADWSHLRELVDERYARLELSYHQNTADEAAERNYLDFIEHVYPLIQAADQKLKEKLLVSGLEPAGFEIPLRNMRAEAGLFRLENLPLQAQDHRLGSEYNKLFGAQTLTWDGEEVTPTRLRLLSQSEERPRREAAWRLASERILADREAINSVWARLMDVRGQIAANAGLPDYRAYRWMQLFRFDYTPADCARFHDAIEKVVVPAATRIYARTARSLGLDRLRPWDLDLDLYPLHLPPLQAYTDPADLAARAETIFYKVHPDLGQYFTTLRREGLLDLENRKGKSPGAFCTSFATEKRPFVFMNAVGLSGDVRTLLHECGHAFHVFERTSLPYQHQWRTTQEFNEVAAMSMELLGSPYLSKEQGGFYDEAGAARANLEQIEKIIIFWPYMAVVDAFQHWAYENHAAASDPRSCDAKWTELWRRFIPGVDWSGLEDAEATGWHRKLHIYNYPFYYVDYGIAQLGAVQVWRNAMQDREAAIQAYRRALALGGTKPLPELFAAAGLRFAFDQPTMETTIAFLESQAAD